MLSIHSQILEDPQQPSLPDAPPHFRPSPIDYIANIWNLPWSDKFYGILTGCVEGLGYVLYFHSAHVIPPTVALGVASCEPLATIVIAALTSKELKYSDNTIKGLMGLSSLCFVVAIALMVVSQSQ